MHQTWLGMDIYVVAGVVMLLSITAYALLAGADFGAGVLDIFTAGPRKELQQRALANAIGPIWETNHIWIILLLVILFSCFPAAIYTISVGLYAPLILVLLGIVFRGAAYIFRQYNEITSPQWRLYGSIFGSASIITPFVLGTMLAAVSGGGIRYQGGQVTVNPAQSWASPFALLTGLLTLLICAYLAAVYMTVETEGDLAEDFRIRGLRLWVAVAVLPAILLPVVRSQVPLLWDHFVARPSLLPMVLGVVCVALSGWSLYRRAYHLARIFAVAEVVVLLWGWAFAQYPYIVYPDVTLANAATKGPALVVLLNVLPFGLILLVPSLWLLYSVFKGEKQHLD
jgi:cytochrome d ubiquinol oxidase subunit II